MEKMSSNMGSSSGNSSSGGDDEVLPSIIEMDEHSQDRSISLVGFFLKMIKTIILISLLFYYHSV